MNIRQIIKTKLFKHPKTSRVLWRLFRKSEASSTRLADIAMPPPSVDPSVGPLRVLICTSISAHPTAFRVDSLIAREMVRRGHEVTMLLCDGVLDACQDCEYRWAASEADFISNGPSRNHCGTCKISIKDRLPGVKYLFYSELLDQEFAVTTFKSRPLEDWFSLRDGDIFLGEHIRAGALRFLAKGTINQGNRFERQVVDRYGAAAIKTLEIARRLASENMFDRVILHHGIYVPQGVLCDVLKRTGLPLYTWALGYRSSCLLFAKGDTYHKVFASDMIGWDNFDLGPEAEKTLDDYLRSRGAGTQDWVSWNRNAKGLESEPSVAAFIERFPDRCFGLFTNVFWDAQLHFEHSIFNDMLDWIVQTIQWFAEHQECGLIVRVHPAEVTGSVPSRQLIIDELAKPLPILPPNVLIVSPNQMVSSYEIAARCRSALIYGTKMGMELAALGMPVITAGDAWVRGKKITFDPASAQDYFELIDRAGRERLDFDVQRAKKFAYFYFFRKMIEVKSLARGGFFSPVVLNPIDEDSGLSLICAAIEQQDEVVN